MGSSGAGGNPPRQDGGARDAGAEDLDSSVAQDAAVVPHDASAIDDAGDAGDDVADSAVPEAGDDARIDYAKLTLFCEAPPVERDPYQDEAELIELLVGKWIGCRNSTGFHPDQDGVWFRQDKTWAALFVEPNATVRTGAGVDETGEWDIYYEPDPGPQRPALSVGGGFIVRPAFTRGPFQLRNISEDEDGTYLDRYVRLRDVLQEPGAPVPAGCANPVELPLLEKNSLGELEPSAEGSGIVRCVDGSMNRERAVRCPVIDDNAHCETDDDCEAVYGVRAEQLRERRGLRE